MKTKFLFLLLSLTTSLCFGAENPPKIGEFCWNELATPDLQKSKEFYGKVFGWEFVENKMGDMTYTMIKINGKEGGGMWSIPQDKQQEIPSHWMSYILVENVEAALEKATKNGATVVKPVTTIKDTGKFTIIKDTTGAHIALWQSLRKPS